MNIGQEMNLSLDDLAFKIWLMLPTRLDPWCAVRFRGRISTQFPTAPSKWQTQHWTRVARNLIIAIMGGGGWGSVQACAKRTHQNNVKRKWGIKVAQCSYIRPRSPPLKLLLSCIGLVKRSRHSSQTKSFTNSLFWALRLWGRRKEIWARKTARGWGNGLSSSLFFSRSLTSRRTPLYESLEQTTLLIVLDRGLGWFRKLSTKSSISFFCVCSLERNARKVYNTQISASSMDITAFHMESCE